MNSDNDDNKINLDINMNTNNNSLKTEWTKLKNMKFIKKCRALCLDNNSLLIIPETMELGINEKILYKYNLKKQEMEALDGIFLNGGHKFMGHDAVYDRNKNTVFICNGNKYLFDINLKTKKMKYSKPTKIGYDARLELGHNQLHVLGGADNERHKIFHVGKYNTYQKGKKLGRIQKPATYTTASNIYCFGGEILRNGTCRILKDVQSYSLTDKTWSKVGAMSGARSGAGICCIYDQYICLFGGITRKIHRGGVCSLGVLRPSSILTDEILIYDLLTHSFSSCTIKCPRKDLFHALFIDDKYESEVLTDGWIKQLFNTQDMKHMALPPVYIMGIISKYKQNGSVVLIEARGKGIYRMNATTIINALQ